jgi:ABC-type transport system involved in multi-copper enzyme maturation permease subunit
MTSKLTNLSRAGRAIAVNTFREAFRNKVFGTLMFFTVLLLLLSMVLGEMSLHNELRVTRNVTLFASTIFSAVISIYSSVTLFHTEFERRTIYTILSKPIPRWLFLVGKYVGVQALMAVIVAVQLGVTWGLMKYQGAELTQPMVWSHVTLYLQLTIIGALALLFATFASPLLAGFATSSLFIAGNLFSQLKYVRILLEERSARALARLIDVLELVLPNLEALNLSHEVTYSTIIPASYVGGALLYTASYTAVILLLAMIIFERRDIA